MRIGDSLLWIVTLFFYYRKLKKNGASLGVFLVVFSDEMFSSLLPTSSDEIQISSLKKPYFVKIFSDEIQISSL